MRWLSLTLLRYLVQFGVLLKVLSMRERFLKLLCSLAEVHIGSETTIKRKCSSTSSQFGVLPSLHLIQLPTLTILIHGFFENIRQYLHQLAEPDQLPQFLGGTAPDAVWDSNYKGRTVWDSLFLGMVLGLYFYNDFGTLFL